MEKLVDNRGIRRDPFTVQASDPLLNPVSWAVRNHEDGFYLKDDIFGAKDDVLYRVVNNKIVEAFKLIPLEEGIDIL